MTEANKTEEEKQEEGIAMMNDIFNKAIDVRKGIVHNELFSEEHYLDILLSYDLEVWKQVCNTTDDMAAIEFVCRHIDERIVDIRKEDSLINKAIAADLEIKKRQKKERNRAMAKQRANAP